MLALAVTIERQKQKYDFKRGSQQVDDSLRYAYSCQRIVILFIDRSTNERNTCKVHILKLALFIDWSITADKILVQNVVQFALN